ncbi:DUF2806 domain-containing protein [Xanthobacter flavus]|uniref:DUF2806 domain-containing protein n=1 Tax=Xanthobacter flavus TaxID=281 RepID=UPI003729A90D
MSGNDIVPSEGGVLAEFGSGLKSIPGAVKAIARLVGMGADTGISWLDVLKALAEQKASGIRNDTAASLAVSKAITKEAVKHVATDEALAERAVATFMSDAIRKQENRERVAKAAIEDLQADPPPSDTQGPSEDWISKFQRYAEDVSAEEVQIMWGRILAAEIRRPGLVGTRVLRAIDEIDSQTADIFNKFDNYICDDAIIKCLSGIFDFNSLTKLVEAGLVIDPGMVGHIRMFQREKNNGGQSIWLTLFGDFAIGFSADVDLSSIQSVGIIHEESGSVPPLALEGADPRVPIYVLTSVGFALSKILFKDYNKNIKRYASILATVIKPSPVFIYRRTLDDQFLVVEEVRA